MFSIVLFIHTIRMAAHHPLALDQKFDKMHWSYQRAHMRRNDGEYEIPRYTKRTVVQDRQSAEP